MCDANLRARHTNLKHNNTNGEKFKTVLWCCVFLGASEASSGVCVVLQQVNRFNTHPQDWVSAQRLSGDRLSRRTMERRRWACSRTRGA